MWRGVDIAAIHSSMYLFGVHACDKLAFSVCGNGTRGSVLVWVNQIIGVKPINGWFLRYTVSMSVNSILLGGFGYGDGLRGLSCGNE